MLIIRFLRFLSGYVVFTAKGGFTERFVNLCTLNRIPLWNMKKYGDTLWAQTSIDGFKHMRRPARGSGVSVRLESKHGLPFFLNRNRRRKGILTGFALSMLIVLFLSSTVWTISVEGNRELTEAQVLSAFEQLGVRRGAFTASVRASGAAEKATELLPELLWASVNVRGSRVEIVVCERTDAPEFPDTSSPCNIVAAEDGVITAIQAEIGEQAVSAGDAVVKGDLLISGVTQNLDMSAELKPARGNVIAVVQRKAAYDCTQRHYYTESYYNERTVLYFFGIKIPLGFKPSGDSFHSEESCLSNGKTTLPAGIIKERSYSCENETEVPQGYRSLLNADLYVKNYCEMSCESEITKEEILTDSGNLSNGFQAELTLEKDIGRRQEIFVENEG